MNRNMNEKINQVNEDTLVIGIDIAKRKHYACAMDDRGRVLQKSFPFHQSSDGFMHFLQRIGTLQTTHAKSNILVGFEPTGHYWMNLADFLMVNDIPFVMVNPMHVSRTKELDDNLQTKNDAKDARVIAQLIRDGRYSFPRILQGVEAELRNGSSFRLKWQEDIAALKNRIIRWTDRYFPEFQWVFKEIGKNALAVLEQTPFPTDMQDKSLEELLQLYRQVEGLKYPSSPKIKQLQQYAHTSIGLSEGHEMARFEIHCLLEQYRQLQAQYEVLAERLTQLAKEMTDYEYLLSIPGVGENTVVELLAETGPLTNYKHPRQLLKLAGLTLRENSSGQHKGQKKISKRGRRKLRGLLFRAILPMIRYNVAFQALYEYYITRPNNPLRKKEAMVVLCGKLLKIAHALCQKKVYFDAQTMMKDLTCLEPLA